MYKNILDPNYDIEYERKYAEDNNQPIRPNTRMTVEVNMIDLRNSDFKDSFLEQRTDYMNNTGNKSGFIQTDKVYMIFESLDVGKFWYKLFMGDFENLTMEDIKKKYPEDYI